MLYSNTAQKYVQKMATSLWKRFRPGEGIDGLCDDEEPNDKLPEGWDLLRWVSAVYTKQYTNAKVVISATLNLRDSSCRIDQVIRYKNGEVRKMPTAGYKNIPDAFEFVASLIELYDKKYNGSN